MAFVIDTRALQITVLVVTVLFSAFSINLFNGSLPLYLYRSRGFSVQSVGFLFGTAFVVQLLATVFVGPLVDRRGARLALRLGAAVYLGAALLLLVAGSPVSIVAARALQGMGFALVVPAAYTVVPTLVSPRFRGTALGGFGAFLNIALAIGPPVGLWLLGRSASALFLAAVATAALGCLASMFLTVGQPAPGRERLFTYRESWTPLLAVTFLTVIYWGVVSAYLPIHVPRALVAGVGWFFTADAAAVLVVRIPAGFLTDRLGPRLLFLVGIGVSVGAIVLLTMPPSLGILVLAGVGTGAGGALLIPPTLVELGKRSDDGDRGTAMALFTASFAAAIGVGSFTAAPIVQHLGFNAALLLSGVSCAAAGPLVLATIHEGR
jgi:MFS family permease